MGTASAVGSGTWVPETPASGKAGQHVGHDRLVRALGCAGALVGVRLLLAPKTAVEAIGVGDAPGHRTAAELVGVKNLAAAAGLLLRPSPVWLWGRVGGDLMDMALLGFGASRSGLIRKNTDRRRATRA